MGDETEPFLDQALKTIRGLQTAAEALGASPQSDWRPIASAPRKPSQRMLLWLPWTEPGAGCCWIGMWGPYEDGWGWICADDCEHLGDPTHWMPLPAPPTR